MDLKLQLSKRGLHGTRIGRHSNAVLKPPSLTPRCGPRMDDSVLLMVPTRRLLLQEACCSSKLVLDLEPDLEISLDHADVACIW
jgi:hypothetical protein